MEKRLTLSFILGFFVFYVSAQNILSIENENISLGII